ncbi:hypothetical protein [Teredinibacter sp. KSP-S5-2]|uniref:hypothetical protein n=1 Tax=Teredinibacter sp. KSP-S5-2 TaxID=3034506 RepID=UPI00293440EA|nr:hypothetical protein [Teredinibacter sp. KSP-S5-2]WNO08615.1 hypothetical protein P5V12_16715 [Teredinibacter sp. KSP-S5-2]
MKTRKYLIQQAVVYCLIGLAIAADAVEDGSIHPLQYDIIVPIVPDEEYLNISKGIRIIPKKVEQNLKKQGVRVKYLPTARAMRTFAREESYCYYGGTSKLLTPYVTAALIESPPKAKLKWFIATAKNDKIITDINKLKGKTIGIPKGVNPKHHFRDYEAYNFVFATRSSLIRMLTFGSNIRLDAAILDSDYKDSLLQQVSVDTSKPLVEYGRTLSCFAKTPHSRDLLKAFNQAFENG